jgi:hypothetical protein
LTILLLFQATALHAEDDVGEIRALMQQDAAAEQRPEATVTSAGKHNQRLSETPATTCGAAAPPASPRPSAWSPA